MKDLEISKNKVKKHISKLAKKYKNKKFIAYGAGKFAQEIFKKYDLSGLNIVAVVDKKFEEQYEKFFMNIKTIIPSEIINVDFDAILITNKDYFFFKKIVENLLNGTKHEGKTIYSILEENPQNLPHKNLINSLANNTDFKISNIKKNIVKFENNKISFLVDAIYPWIANEIFKEEIYKIHYEKFDYQKKYTVFDIGSNHGYASLYYANQPWVKKVYAFELFPQTFKFAEKSIKTNRKDIQKKIKRFNFGLSNISNTIESYYLKNRDGISSLNLNFLNNYAPKEINNIKKTKCKVRKASEVLKKLIEKNKIENIIFKIDVEGAEYDIIENLSINYPEIFDKIDLIVGDTHLGFEEFIKYIPEDKFSVEWKNPLNNGTCAFEIIRK